MRSTIICVDDEKMLLNILAEQLGQWFGTRYSIEKALSGEDALQVLDECIANNSDVSLVISDYVMPGMKGDELLSRVSKRDPRIRKIMLTGYSSVEGIANAINNGGLYRFITKPWDTKDLMLTIVEAIRSYETDKKNADLTRGFEALYKRYESLYLDTQRGLDDAIKTISVLTRLREPGRADLAEEAANYMNAFTIKMNIPEADRKNYALMVSLRDIACAGLSDIELALLRKSGLKDTPTDMSRQLLQKYNGVGEKILSVMALPDPVRNAVMYQFERMDGSGPSGLLKGQIPQEAYMLALVCYYTERKADLIQSNAYTRETALRMLQEAGLKYFPADVVLPFAEVIKAEFAQ